MNRRRTLLTLLLSGIALAVTIYIIVAHTKQGSNPGFKDTAAALAFITGASVAVERIIEAVWTILGGLLGTYWPLNTVKGQVDTLVGELDTAVRPIYAEAARSAEKLKEAGKLTDAQLREAKAELVELEKRFGETHGLAPSNQKVQLLAAAAAQNINYLKAKYPDLEYTAGVANTAIDGLQNFIASFKDNPGRRLISLFLGSIIGLILAGAFGLDVFKAVMGTNPDPAPGAGGSALHVVITGIIIGLGAGPTHEVIRALQEFKEGRKGQNTKKPDLP